MHAIGSDEKVASCCRAVLERRLLGSSIDRSKFLEPLVILNLDALTGDVIH